MVWVVNAAPLGPVTAYSYLHAGREPAILFVETRLLFFYCLVLGKGMFCFWSFLLLLGRHSAFASSHRNMGPTAVGMESAIGGSRRRTVLK